MNILSVVRDPNSYMKKLRGCPPGVTFNAAIKFLLLVMTMETWNFQKRKTPKPIDISKNYYFLLFTQTMLKKHCDLSQFCGPLDHATELFTWENECLWLPLTTLALLEGILKIKDAPLQQVTTSLFF